MDEKIQKVIKARGPLESAIREAVRLLVREWEKKNGARISDIYFPIIKTKLAGLPTQYEFGFVHVDIVMPNGTEISGPEIRQYLTGGCK